MDDQPDPKDIPPEAKRGRERDATAVDDAPVIRDGEEDETGPDASEAPDEEGSASPR